MNWKTIEIEIRAYSKHMSLDKAVAKVKRNHLGRIDFVADELGRRLKNEM